MLLDTKTERNIPKYNQLISKRRVAMAVGAGMLIVGALSNMFSWSYHNHIGVDYIEQCGRMDPILPEFNKSIKMIFESPDFKEKAISRLAGAIQIPTEVFDDNPSPSEDIEYYHEFFKLHDYLVNSFPLVSKHLKLEKVNEVNLLFTWEGKDKKLKPMMLTSHQDVVPVDPETVSQWTYPPFSGHYDASSDLIYGRGALDCKTLLIAQLAAIEQLIEDGFEPTRTVIVALGFDEETAGLHGARTMGKFLHERYGDNGIYSIVDEGSMVAEISKNVFIAAPVVQEKGYLDVNITVLGNGGHSSIPPEHTTIGVAAEIISSLENKPFKFEFSLENPFYGFLVCMAEHSNSLPAEFKKAIIEARFDEKERKNLVEFISQRPEMRELIRTSQAVDVFHGGMKANALPQVSTFLVNHRIDIQSSVQEVLESDLSVAREVAEKYGYGLYLADEEVIPCTDVGSITVTGYKPLEPSPYSPTKGSQVWDIFSGTIQNVFQNGLLRNNSEAEVYVTTNTISANSDTKHYWALTKNIYRFFGNVLPQGLWKTVHSVDETIPASAHLTSIAFVYEYIVNVQEGANEDSLP